MKRKIGFKIKGGRMQTRFFDKKKVLRPGRLRTRLTDRSQAKEAVLRQIKNKPTDRSQTKVAVLGQIKSKAEQVDLRPR